MKYRLLLPLALAACYLACDSANPVAPGGTSLTIIANPTLIALSGEAATITVTGFRPDGNPLFPGTQVRLTTDLGTLDNDLLEIGNGGRAQTQLRGDGKSGPATVQAFIATSGGGGGGDGMGGGGGGTGTASVVVQIGDDDTTRPTIALTASPSTAGLGEQVQVIATLRNADGSIFTGGGNVLFETSLGTLSPTSAPVGSDGRATTTLAVGDQVGTAVVTASFGSATPATVDVAVENQRPTLVVTVNPDDIAIRDEAEISVLARDINGNPIAGGDVQLFTSLGGLVGPGGGQPQSSLVVTTQSNGVATATFVAGNQAGDARITAILGTSDPVETIIQIRDVIGFFDLAVDPMTIDRPAQGGAGVTVTLTARVQNALGQPIANVTVNFLSSVGGTFAPSSSRITNTSGTAQVTLTVTEAQVGAGVTFFDVTATAVGEAAPGVPTEITERVIVRP